MSFPPFYRLTSCCCMLLAPLALGCAPRAQSRAQGTPQANFARENAREHQGEAAHALPGHFATLVERARLASAKPAPPVQEAALSPALRDADWNTYRMVRYLPERSLWRGEPGHFEAQFFHLGFIYRTPVNVFVIDGAQVRELPFAADRFSYAGVPAPASEAGLGYAGLRLHTNLNSADYRDELIVFQGASYFRALGRGNALGLSARALAVDTGETSPEEFPRFSELYLVRPEADARSVWVLGLIDSKRLTGACAFRIQPEDATRIDVELRVFLREPVGLLGIAPFSSMHLFGEAEPHRFGDARPEVHDSDGLSMWSAAGERLFRPLRNPRRTKVSDYRFDSPRGFGLVQRDRDAASYQDPEQRYQDRPSAWVEPLGDWGPGRLRLLEIATALESDDNIALLWVPDQVPREGLSVRYRLHFGAAVEGLERFGHVVATRASESSPERARFEVDFQLPDAARPGEGIQLELSADGGEVISRQLILNPSAGGFRASFEVLRKDSARDLPLRAFLRAGNDVLTETWSYAWQAKS